MTQLLRIAFDKMDKQSPVFLGTRALCVLGNLQCDLERTFVFNKKCWVS